MDRLLRVDVVGKSSAGGPGVDPKLTIFVGNLDFASKEEDLRVFFEGVVSTERGEPSPLLEDMESEEDEEEGEKNQPVKKERTWVSRVRIVRDRETQLGKGFAYVQFAVRSFRHSQCLFSKF
jgi:nucleolar protein 12